MHLVRFEEASHASTPVKTLEHSVGGTADKSVLKSKLFEDLSCTTSGVVEALANREELMENLSLQDLPPAGGPNHVQPVPEDNVSYHRRAPKCHVFAAENEAVIAAAAESRRLYIGNLAYATTERELKSFFTGYSVYVQANGNSNERHTSSSERASVGGSSKKRSAAVPKHKSKNLPQTIVLYDTWHWEIASLIQDIQRLEGMMRGFFNKKGKGSNKNELNKSSRVL